MIRQSTGNETNFILYNRFLINLKDTNKAFLIYLEILSCVLFFILAYITLVVLSLIFHKVALVISLIYILLLLLLLAYMSLNPKDESNNNEVSESKEPCEIENEIDDENNEKLDENNLTPEDNNDNQENTTKVDGNKLEANDDSTLSYIENKIEDNDLCNAKDINPSKNNDNKNILLYQDKNMEAYNQIFDDIKDFKKDFSGILDKKVNDKETVKDIFLYLKELTQDTSNMLFTLLLFNEEDDKANIIYQIILSLFILMSQVYTIVIASMNFNSYHDIGKAGIVLGIIYRIFFLFKIIDLNIFNALFRIKKTWALFKDKFTFCFILLLYFIAIATLIAIAIISKFYDYPYVDYVYYENRKDIPFIKSSLRQTPDIPKGFCQITTDDDLTAVDLSILTTLPRLYNINDDGKCYIKPKFRGVFNATMKYIFGSDYHTKGIRIYCWTKMHEPYLVITSEESYNQKLNTYSEEDVEILSDDEFIQQTKSEEYFNDTDHLCDYGYALNECNSLKQCIENSQTDCEEEWSSFTNNYWKAQSENYNSNMKGLEQYQITITDDFLFQPRFIYNNYSLAGTHYIVGGGVENQWGYAALIENTIRVFIPEFFGEFLPFFNYVYDFFEDMFSYFSEFALTFIYVDSVSTNEIRELGNLISHFNFSYSNLYMVGHSLSATTMKELSYVTNISGIAFEGSTSLGYAQFRVSDSFSLSENNLNDMANIFSGSSFLTGEDEVFDTNGKLPDLFYNPNVYDTACLTAVTCSSTENYVPFCQQVLNQHGKDPLVNYNALLDAYYNQ